MQGSAHGGHVGDEETVNTGEKEAETYLQGREKAERTATLKHCACLSAVSV